MSMFPIRCVVECVNEGECVKCTDRGLLVADSFAIVAGQTPLSQLVDTVMTALGLQHLSSGAKAWIQLKNWKPLTFDQITDEPDLEIECLLKDVSNQLTLRVLTKQSDTAMLDCVRDMKDRLLKAMSRKMPKLFQEAYKYHPQLKDLINQLVEGDPSSASPLDADQMHQFNSWLEEFNSTSASPPSSAGTGGIGGTALLNVHQNGFYLTPTTTNNDRSPKIDRYSSSSSFPTNPNSTPATTRFSPLLEVPKLERWFRDNPNPSRQKLQYYMQILNGSNFRKHAGNITYQQICNWFSNARASHRKKETCSSISSSKSDGNGNGNGNNNIRSILNRSSSSSISNRSASSNRGHRSAVAGRPTNTSNSISAINKNMDQSSSSSTTQIDSSAGLANNNNSAGGMNSNQNPQQHWVSKVFSNNVSNLSIAFNDFIQSTPTPPHQQPTITPSAGQQGQLFSGGGSAVDVNIPVEDQGISEILETPSSSTGTGHSPPGSSGHQQTSGGRGDSAVVTLNVGGPAGGLEIDDDDDEDEGEQIIQFDQEQQQMMDQDEEEASDDSHPITADQQHIVPPISVGAMLKAAISEGLPSMTGPGRLPSMVSSGTSTPAGNNNNNNRTRLMFDPLTEIPMLEAWFEENPHPSWAQVDQYTEHLNSLSYRLTYPAVSAHNLKIWFKNRRAKCKRLMNGGNNGDGSISGITVKIE